MKVLYDIAVLGKGHYDLHYKTGIHRVVENIALALAASGDCDLHFCASVSLENVNQAIDYLQANHPLEHIPLISLGIEKSFYEKLTGKINRLLEQPQRALELSTLRNAFQALRESLHYERARAGKSFPILSSQALSTIDLYHSPFHPFPGRLKALKSIKKIVTIHDLIPIIHPKFFEFNRPSSVEKVINNAEPDDCFICVSNSTKNDLCNYRSSIDSSHVFVTHLAASEYFYPCNDEEEIYSIKKKFNIPDVPYILSLNTLEPRKNIAHTIRCFAKLVEQENIKDLCLVITGRKGWGYDNIFDELSNASSLKERIIYTGYAANENLAALYSGAIAFAFPSFYEGFGLPPLEAMQCGVPVITSNTSSLPEVVGDAGIIISPEDGDALCQSMLEIYRNSSLRKSLSAKSIEQAKKFSWQKCAGETIQAYKTALSV
ncbi:MAG: glycosyltransferase family 1 protein [Deltaproteobacteria bacterium]|nr:glycosyltransferase family 1 protein [Deltaproteobacteria bacterium]